LNKEIRSNVAEVLGQSRAIRARLLLVVLLILGYLILEWFSFLQEFRGVPITPWNPGLGVLFAFMLARRLAYGWVLFAAIVASEFVLLDTAVSWYSVVLIAAIASLIYTVAAATIRTIVRDNLEFDRVQDVVTLALVGSVASLIVGALLSAIFISGEHSQRTIMLQMFIGDLVGIMVMTPLVLRLLRFDIEQWRLRLSPLKYLEIVLQLGFICAALAVLKHTGLQNFYILFVPIVIVAVRYGFDGACVAIATVQFGLAAILHAIGADAALSLEFQTAMLALTTAGLFVGAEVNARIRADNLAKAAEAKLRRQEEANAQAERFAIVESMASGLAHEINQPMTAIRALVRSSQVLIDGPTPDLARVGNNLGTAITQIDHAADVIKRMRDFLKRRQLNLERVSTRDLLTQAPLLSRSQIRGNVAVDAEIGPENYQVDADRVQIMQVFLNLIHNSVQSIRSVPSIHGRVTIGAEHKTDPERIEFFVRDNGPGVPPKRRKTLFEPLRTTKSDGLGLGLPICLTIVEAHGGQIWLENGQAGATEFRFWLPLK
jgi:two-component system sensor kinase FixL